MRIAMLYTPLVTAGGAERQLFEEAAQLRARGHDMSVLTFRLDDDALFVDSARRKDIEVLRSRGGPVGQVLVLRSALRRIAPDVLVSHTSPELTWLATRGSKLPCVQYHNSPPFYIGEHANPYMASRRYRNAFPQLRDGAAGYADFARPTHLAPWSRMVAETRTALKHRAIRAARAVIVPSARTARELRLLHGVEATVVRGCLPSSLLDAAPARSARSPQMGPVILSVCRLEPVKRIDLLLRAFAEVRRAQPSAALVIAGTGSDESRLRGIARSLALGADAVRFEGYVPEDRLWEWYAAADVFAAPAMADFIIAPYEAMALGCRAVWTTEMETDPAIEASGQVFVAAPEERAFAQAMLNAIDAGDVAHADLRSMTWEARGERLDHILRAAASRPQALSEAVSTPV